MRKPKRFRLWTICLISASAILLLGFRFRWLYLFGYTDMKHNAAVIASAPPLPQNFLRIWDKLYPGTRGVSMSGQDWSMIFGDGRRNCRCDEIGYLAWNNAGTGLKFDMRRMGRYRDFGYGLEHFVSPEDCFNFWINNDILWKDRYLHSLDELAGIVYGKEVVRLNNEEVVGLIVYLKITHHRNFDSTFFGQQVRTLQSRLKQQ